MRTVTLKQFAQEEQVCYATCTKRVRRLGIAPVAFGEVTKRGVKPLLYPYDELLKIKQLGQDMQSGTTTLRRYADEKGINYKTLKASVYWSNLVQVGETCSIAGSGRKARLFNISDLNKLRIRKR